MLRSIRWRLVASYLLLTVIAVGLVGVLALSLVGNFVAQQQRASLQANAQAVASEAQSLIWPVTQQADLNELSRTAAFLGNARVRILDRQQVVLADSGSATLSDDLVWMLPPDELGLGGDLLGAFIMPMQGMMGNLTDTGLPGKNLTTTRVTLVRRVQGPWGDRIAIETRDLPGLSVPAADDQSAEAQALRQTWAEVFGRLAGDTAAPASAAPVLEAGAIRVMAAIGDASQPLGTVEVIGQPEAAQEALILIRRAFLLAALAAAGLAMVFGLAMSQGLTAPLKSLATTAARMGEGDLAARAPVRGGVEVEQAAQQFNLMAARLETSFAELAAERDALRRFIADASHQLRTPITALKNFIDLLQGPASADAEARQEFLAESQTQIERLEWITAHLLDLSRYDAGLAQLELGDHDAGEIVEAVAGLFRTRAHEQHVELDVITPDAPIMLHCDRPRIELALGNLVDNALKFTPAEGRVQIGAEAGESAVCFWVQDSGAGIAPADQPHIFERFYRGANGGTGLGLAIVRSIVQAHGGRVRLAATGAQGSRFEITLPDQV